MTSPDPLVQIQNDFTELFLISHPTTKIAQMVSIYWTKGLPELLIRNVFKQHILLNHCSKFTHKAHYHTCTNGLEALNKKAARAIDKKYLKWPLLLNNWSKFKINVPHHAFYQNWSECLAQLNNMATVAKIDIAFNDISLATDQIHYLICQDSDERARALGPSCFISFLLLAHQSRRLRVRL